MLTVDYRLLKLKPGERILDMGCGAGRHAFESFRRGAHVVAFDMDEDELRGVSGLFAAMEEAGESGDGAHAGACVGNGLTLPFPDDSFDRIIASEVLEHVPDDTGAMAELFRVLKPGGTIAVTVPSWLPEQICWALSEEYHAPFVTGGHVRIYTEVELRKKLRDAGFAPRGAHRAHALHSPYWWLRCAGDPHDDNAPLVEAYHKLLVWDMVDKPVVTRVLDSALNPVIGKSLIVYAKKHESAMAGASA